MLHLNSLFQESMGSFFLHVKEIKINSRLRKNVISQQLFQKLLRTILDPVITKNILNKELFLFSFTWNERKTVKVTTADQLCQMSKE